MVVSPPQDGCPGVDHHPITDGRVPLCLGHILANAQGTEGNPLVNLDIVTDNDRFPEYNARAMIDAEALTDSGAGVNFYPGLAVSDFAQHSGNEWNAELAQGMRDPVDGERVETGVGTDHFGPVTRRGVAGEDSIGVLGKCRINTGEVGLKGVPDLLGRGS